VPDHAAYIEAAGGAAHIAAQLAPVY
jgi:hypothetical protein